MSINIVGLFVGFIMLILVLGIPPLLLWGFIRSVRAKRQAWSIILGFVTVAVFSFYVRVAYAVAPLGDKRVAGQETADGTMAVFQHCNYSGEPYTTRFYFRPNSGPWQCYYMDHEDTRWFNGRIEYDSATSVARIYRGNAEAGSFDVTTQTFTRPGIKNGKPYGIATTNYWTLPPDLEPGDELKKEHSTKPSTATE